MKFAVKKNHRRGFAQGLFPRAVSPFPRPACALPLGQRRIAMQPAFPFYPILPHFACHATRTRCGARFQVQGSPTPKHAVALATLQRPAVFWLTVNLLFCDNVPAIPVFQGMAESIKTATPVDFSFTTPLQRFVPSAEGRSMKSAVKKPPQGQHHGFLLELSTSKIP